MLPSRSVVGSSDFFSSSESELLAGKVADTADRSWTGTRRVHDNQ